MSGKSISRLVRAGVMAAVVLTLAACATPDPLGSLGTGDAAHYAVVRTGRFAVQVVQADGKQDAVQGGFAWRDEGSRLRLDLSTPMGATLARIDASSAQARLTRSDGSVELAEDPDALARRVLGADVPVSGLRTWLQGRPLPGAPVEGARHDAAGRLVWFEQDGWQVALERYREDGTPGLVRLSRQTADRRVSVRLVMS